MNTMINKAIKKYNLYGFAMLWLHLQFLFVFLVL